MMAVRRTPQEIAEKIVEECGWGKITGSLGLTDGDPLVVVMYRVAQKIRNRGGSFEKAKARKVWCRALTMLQEYDDTLEHNTFIPCRWCDQAFEPVIDDRLLTLFLRWYNSSDSTDLLAIHRCPACGGQIGAKRTKPYHGDMHTPQPGSVENDDAWVDLLLKHSSL